MKTLLLEPATDWTNQKLHERMQLAAQLLYVHGYMARAEYLRTRDKLTADLAAEQSRKVRRA